ncbi:hypothetical protein OC834_002511 [Tilletia horrida]|nr:hypothetical protein OC834_002511 [Tilletia horrida]
MDRFLRTVKDAHMEHAQEKLTAFIDWCDENDVELHGDLQIELGVQRVMPSSQDAEAIMQVNMAVFLREGSKIDVDKGVIAASIPKTAILSPQSSSLRHFDPTFTPCSVGVSEHNDEASPALATPQLALCIMHELILGPASRFWPYLATLPPRGVRLPRMWTSDSTEHRLIRGTEVERLLRHHPTAGSAASPDHCASDRFLRDFFKVKGFNHLLAAHPDLLKADGRSIANSSNKTAVAASEVLRLDRMHLYALRGGFTGDELWTLYDMTATLVSTRSFVIDYYHVFNHHPSHHVEFECDDIVCAECGALFECEHDDGEGEEARDEGERRARVGQDAPDEEVDTVNLRFVKSCAGRMEVFNTYGDLSNAQLLIRYGFAVREHKSAQFSWALPHIGLEDAIELRAALGISAAAADVLEMLRVVDETRQELRSSSSPPDIDSAPSERAFISRDNPRTETRPLFIDQDGCMSETLWLLALALTIRLDKTAFMSKERLLDAHCEWWDGIYKSRRQRTESFGELTVVKVTELVSRRLDVLMEVGDDELFQEQSDTDQISSTTRFAALCHLEERVALRLCLDKLKGLSGPS